VAASWELRLYSRDPRLATKQVHKVLYPHTPREPDELELRIGDYIYLNSDALQNSSDGWVEGISWLTGITGYLPENYTERTAESDAWTMQKSVQLCKALSPENTDTVDGGSTMELRNNSEETSMSLRVYGSHSLSNPHGFCSLLVSIDRSESNNRSHLDLNPEEVYDQMANRSESIDLKAIAASSRTNSVDNLTLDQNTTRKVYILRHGERVDFTFRTWMACCFDAAGDYTRQDLNMPKSLPQRKSGISGWQKDSPLTNIGEFQARLTGDCMREHGVTIDHVYCSPSFRCVQTCTNILEGLRCKQPINIEPGLFEWLAWYTDSLPNFMAADELCAHKYNVNAAYEPIFTVADLDGVKHENLEQFYQRNSKAAIDIINGTSEYSSKICAAICMQVACV
jgi:ubiquitin-associated and SH3 domain-containing protein